MIHFVRVVLGCFGKGDILVQDSIFFSHRNTLLCCLTRPIEVIFFSNRSEQDSLFFSHRNTLLCCLTRPIEVIFFSNRSEIISLLFECRFSNFSCFNCAKD